MSAKEFVHSDLKEEEELQGNTQPAKEGGEGKGAALQYTDYRNGKREMQMLHKERHDNKRKLTTLSWISSHDYCG